MSIKIYVFNYKQFKFTLGKMRQKYDSNIIKIIEII